MTKKINATTFRLGYNIFWYYKISNSFFPLKFRNIFNICKKKLKINNYICLNFLFRFNYICILIYISYKKNVSFFNTINFIKNKKIKYQSYLNNYLRSNKFILCYFKTYKYMNFFVKNVKQKCNFYIKKKINYYFKFINNYNYLQKIKNQIYILYNLLSHNHSSSSNYFFYFNQFFNYFQNVSKLKYKTIVNKNYHQILILKKEETSLELLINIWFKYKWNIYLNNIFNNLNFNKFLNRFDNQTTTKQNKKQQIKIKKYNLLIYSYFLFKNTKLICKHLAGSLLKTNRHIKNIQFLLNRIYYLYYQKILNFMGFKFYLSGKLNGKMKRQKYSYKIGKMLLQVINFKIMYSFFNLYTKFGVFSIKIWLC